jgi:DNA primase catalytic subunit
MVGSWCNVNQLTRRNLTKDAFTLALGRRYNRTKKAAGRPKKGDNRLVVRLSNFDNIEWRCWHSVASSKIKRVENRLKAKEEKGRNEDETGRIAETEKFQGGRSS